MKIKRSSWHYKMVSWFDKRNSISTDNANNVEYVMRVIVGLVVTCWGLLGAFSLGFTLVLGVAAGLLIILAPALVYFDIMPTTLNVVEPIKILSIALWSGAIVNFIVFVIFKVWLKLLLTLPVRITGKHIIENRWLSKIELED